MTSRHLYIKFTGFLLVVIGLSYSITSLYNMFTYLYSNVTINGSNKFIMILGVLIPIFMFVFGLFYFMYYDKDITKINKKIFICAIILIILGIIILIFKNNYLLSHAFTISQFAYFLHSSLGIISIILGLMVMYSSIKYKL